MFKKLMAGILCGALVLSLGACGSKDKDKTEVSVDVDTGSSIVEADSDIQVKDETASDKKFDTVLDLLNDPVTSSAVNASISAAGDNEQFVVSVVGSEDTLTYMFQFTEESFASIDEDMLKEQFDEMMGKNEASFQSIANGIAEMVNVEAPKVEVLYVKPDGTDLLSYVYTADDSGVNIISILTDENGDVVGDSDVESNESEESSALTVDIDE